MQSAAQRVVGHDVRKHFPHLAHQVDGLVEREDQIALGQFDLFPQFRHRAAAAPGPRRAVEVRIVPLGNRQPFPPLLTKNGLLDVFNPTASEDQPVGKDEPVAVAKLPVE